MSVVHRQAMLKPFSCNMRLNQGSHTLLW